nr:Bicarbonate transporter domain containing protein [Haemonchus contortus]
MTATCMDEIAATIACTSVSSGDEASANGSGDLNSRAYIRKTDPRNRTMTRRTSHTLLFVPEQRRVSTVSGGSVASCPCPVELGEDVNLAPLPPPRFTLNLSPTSSRRKSVQTGAPAIGFRPLRTFERRASQPTLQLELLAKVDPEPPEVVDKSKMLSKRVSWLSMKSLQEGEKASRRTSSPSKAGGSGGGGGDSRTASQYGSQTQLYGEHDFDSDTPPLDTLSWSNAGNEYDNVTLMYAKHEKIPMKDFGSEIRATMDIDHLLNKAVLLLDLQETSLEEIFAKIIHEMDIQEPEFTSEQVRSVLFTQDAGNQFHILSRTVQSICTTGSIGGSFDYDQTWICALCMLNTVQHRHVAIARLSHPTNLGRTMQDLRFIIIVIAPSRAKGTKTALETTRTFATLFADMEIRQRLVMAQSVEAFRSTLLSAAKELAMDQNQWRERKSSIHLSQAKEQIFGPNAWYPFRGLSEEFKRRLAVYPSDFIDGVTGHRTMQKLFSTVVFLYFACLLPAIAFGVLNDDNTNGSINVRKVIIAQAIGGIFFSLCGGQPMIILLTTVPLAIYIKVIFKISQELGYDFFAMYACVGLFCQLFLVLYSATELCSLMKLATRSAEEMFSLFIAIAFTVESIRAIHNIFLKNYSGCDATNANRDNLTTFNNTSTVLEETGVLCRRDTSILYMLLMFGTLWLGLFLYNFRKTPYLTRSRREWLADYALPASVLIMSFTGSYCFSDIAKDRFKLRGEVPIMQPADIFSLPPSGYFVCLLLGFSLSFLFFMDQNITSAIVNNPQNKLKKGSTQNLDLFVVALLNVFLSVFGLPWMHGALPHSPLHLRALADVEERVSQGHVHEVIMNVRETRLATLIAHVMILFSTYYLIPYPLQLIPTSVLHGLFLYMALTSLSGNEMFERLLLLITEQQAYPPTHYIRKVPQRKVHLFTACQLLQLIILCAFGFSPYPFIEMVFPIVCFFFLPIRHTLIPRLIDYKYLDALDGRH